MSQASDNSAPDREAGYLLLEVLIGLVISSALVFLLLSSLNALSRSQERTAQVIAETSQAVFDRHLARSFFAAIKPGYRLDSEPFAGGPIEFTGESYLTGFGTPDGRPFTASVENAPTGAVVLAATDEQSIRVAEVAARNCSFEYMTRSGDYAPRWPPEEGSEPTRDNPDAQTYEARFAHPVPQQIRLVCGPESNSQVLAFWSLGASDWPPVRDTDLQEISPF